MLRLVDIIYSRSNRKTEKRLGFKLEVSIFSCWLKFLIFLRVSNMRTITKIMMFIKYDYNYCEFKIHNSLRELKVENYLNSYFIWHLQSLEYKIGHNYYLLKLEFALKVIPAFRTTYLNNVFNGHILGFHVLFG